MSEDNEGRSPDFMSLSELRQENDRLRKALKAEKQQLGKMAQLKESAEVRLRVAEDQVEKLQRQNNEACRLKEGAEDETGDLRQFFFQVTRALRLEPGSVSPRDVLAEVKKRVRSHVHENLGAGMLNDLRMILDPQGQHATVVEAAKAAVSAPSSQESSRILTEMAAVRKDRDRAQSELARAREKLAAASRQTHRDPDPQTAQDASIALMASAVLGVPVEEVVSECSRVLLDRETMAAKLCVIQGLANPSREYPARTVKVPAVEQVQVRFKDALGAGAARWRPGGLHPQESGQDSIPGNIR